MARKPKKPLRMFDGTEPPVNWLRHARHHGIPALIPCTLDDTPCLAGGVLQLAKGRLEDAQALDDTVRASLAVIACTRLYVKAEEQGATIHIR